MKNRVETKRLVIRRFTLDDADDLFRYASNPNVGPDAGWIPHQNVDESKSLISKWLKDPEMFAITKKTDGKLIGSIGLHQRFERAVMCRELGYVLSEEEWGKGYMSEAVKEMIDYAFEEFGVEILLVKHHHMNMRSKRVIEKAGFTYEGRIRMERKHPITKELLDTLSYSMTKEEWRKLRCLK